MSIIELLLRLVIAHRDIEMKKIDAVKEVVALFRADAEQRYEDFICYEKHAQNNACPEKREKGER